MSDQLLNFNFQISNFKLHRDQLLNFKLMSEHSLALALSHSRAQQHHHDIIIAMTLMCVDDSISKKICQRQILRVKKPAESSFDNFQFLIAHDEKKNIRRDEKKFSPRAPHEKIFL